MALYGLSLNFEKKVNRLFFFMCSSLSFWAFTYTIATVAHHAETALLFNKVSVLGWGTFYGFFLHLTKVLANGGKKVSKKFLVLSYLPSLFFILVFAISGSADAQFHIVKTSWGYTSITPSTLCNVIFTIYALTYSLFAIINAFLWYKNNKEEKHEIPFKLMMALLILSMILSVINDLVLIRLFAYQLIQLTILWLFAPMLAILYALIKTRTITYQVNFDLNDIIDDSAKESVFSVMAYMYLLIGYINFAIVYIPSVIHLKLQIAFSILAVIMAFLHFFLTKMFKTEREQNLFLTFIYMVSISVVAYVYLDSLAVTVWALFFCYVVLTSIFRKTVYSYFMVLYMIILNFVYWYYIPEKFILFTWVDYIGRIFVILLFSSLVFYVKLAYKKKSDSNIRQMQKQKIMSTLAIQIMELTHQNTGQKYTDFMRTLNESFDFKSSCYITINSHPDSNELEAAYYLDGDNSFVTNTYEESVFSINYEWLEAMFQNKEVSILDVYNYDSSYDEIKKEFAKRGISGFYAAPIYVYDNLRAILVCEFVYNIETELMYIYKDMFINLIIDTIKKIDGEKVLFQKANFDDVTGLKKRAYFASLAGEILKRDTSSYYVLFVDIDNFKSINDTFGHIVGDKVLQNVARILEEFGDKNNIICRMSSDEFVIFCDKSYNKADITSYCENILAKLIDGIKINDNKFKLNISIGISHCPEDGETIELLAKNADIAMNKSKKLGSMKYHFCNDLDKQAVIEDSMYTDKLFYALDNEEFYLVFQPQISLEDGSVIGAETLLRWESRDFSLVPPNKFIHILERTGLIVEVGDWIIRESIKQQLKMVEKGIKGIRMAINLSVVQVLDTKFVDRLKLLLEEYPLDPQYIEFEVTESIAINDNIFVLDSLAKIREMGFPIAIDDFGTGYSSLSRLQQLPIDRLKIDKTFIDGIGKGLKKESLVNIIIEFAKHFGLSSIAEGVESEYQVDYLKANGCDEVQGFYFAKPMKAEEFEDFLLASKEK